MDKITRQRIKTLHPDVQEEVTTIFNEIDEALNGRAICRMTQAYRTFSEQQALYEQGRTRKGPIVTWVSGGKSYHNYGLAFDICLLVKPEGSTKYTELSYNTKKDYDGDNVADWDEITKICVKHGWTYLTNKNGRRFDFPHFQKANTVGTAELMKRREKEGNYPRFT